MLLSRRIHNTGLLHLGVPEEFSITQVAQLFIYRQSGGTTCHGCFSPALFLPKRWHFDVASKLSWPRVRRAPLSIAEEGKKMA